MPAARGGARVLTLSRVQRQVVSTMGTTALEEVAAAAADPSQHMFQLYVIKDRDFTRQLVQVRSEATCGVQHTSRTASCIASG